MALLFLQARLPWLRHLRFRNVDRPIFPIYAEQRFMRSPLRRGPPWPQAAIVACQQQDTRLGSCIA